MIYRIIQLITIYIFYTCIAIRFPHRFITRFPYAFSTEPSLWFISRNETLFTGTVTPRLLEATIFFSCNIEREQKKRERTNSTKFSTYLYIYIARRDKNFGMDISARRTFSLIVIIITKCLDKLILPRSLIPFSRTFTSYKFRVNS